MFRYQSNKQSFAIAVLIILLCLVCLAGATLALFTTTAKGGTIGVVTTAGDLKIDVVDTDGATLRDRALAFMTTSGTVDSENVLFEPGACFYTQGFRVKNDGNIAVNFSFAISKSDRAEAFERAFDVWIVEEGDLNNAVPLLEYKWHLEAGQTSKPYYLFIKMREDVSGLEFQGQTYSGVGVTVYAVQGNVREG